MIRVEQLNKIFVLSSNKKCIAVRNINFSIKQGETLGLVGESGCGKSTLGRTLLRLIEPTSGKIFFQEQEITHLRKKKMKELRRQLQIIFQDPFASLNPRMTVEDILSEPLQIHGIKGSKERARELLDLVHLPQGSLSRFPHEFSGGQRQRIGIARALALRPTFIVCDEPISSLDTSIQAQIINLLLALQKELNLTYLFIGHDLTMVKILSHHVAVMLLGEFVEIGPQEAIYTNPRHPYTHSLLASIPLIDPIQERKRSRMILQGEIPSPFNPPKGCPFCTRCPMAQPICFEQKPPLKEVAPQHQVACFFT